MPTCHNGITPEDRPVGEILAEHRLARGLSIDEVASSLNMTPAGVRYSEAASDIKLSTAIRYARMYQVSLDELVNLKQVKDISTDNPVQQPLVTPNAQLISIRTLQQLLGATLTTFGWHIQSWMQTQTGFVLKIAQPTISAAPIASNQRLNALEEGYGNEISQQRFKQIRDANNAAATSTNSTLNDSSATNSA